MKKTKKKYRRLQAFSLIGLFLPIATVIGFNAKDYFSMETMGFVFPQGVEVGLGLTLSAVGGVLLVIGKTDAFKGSKGLLIALVLSVLLKTIINDIILILTALSAGSLIHSAFKPKINELKEIYKEERSGEISAVAMKNVFDANKDDDKENKSRFLGRA